jgi:hypothetical protein
LVVLHRKVLSYNDLRGPVFAGESAAAAGLEFEPPSPKYKANHLFSATSKA